MLGSLLASRNTEMSKIVLDLKEFTVYSVAFIALLFGAVL